MVVETQKLLACVVLVTCGNVEEAETIAKTIVTERLAACVNVVGRSEGMQSFFIWDNLLQKESEILLHFLVKRFIFYLIANLEPEQTFL